MEGFVAEPVGPKMHRDEDLRLEIFKGAEGFLRIHMVFPEFRAVIGPDGEECDFGVKFFSDFAETRKVTRVAGVVDGPAAHIDHISAISTMVIGDFPGAPVFGGHKGDGCPRKTEPFPPLHFIDFFKSEPVNKIANSGGNDNGLVGGDSSEAAPVEVVKVGVGDENQIDRGEVMMGKTCMAQSTDHQKPVGPVRVDQNVPLMALDEEGCVTDPRDADLALAEFWENRGRSVPMAAFSGEKGGQKHIGDKAMGRPPGSFSCSCTQGVKNDAKKRRRQPCRRDWLNLVIEA